MTDSRSQPNNVEALRQLASDLRRNPSGGDDYPFEFATEIANRIESAMTETSTSPSVDGETLLHLAEELRVSASSGLDMAKTMNRVAYSLQALTRPAPSSTVGELDGDIARMAAEQANKLFSQWMPERWLNLFIDSYNDIAACRAALPPDAGSRT